MIYNARKRGAARPDLPPAVVHKTLKHNDAQAVVLQQLGVALVLQWDSIPDALQDLLLDQAALGAGAVSGDIEDYIRGARVVPLDDASAASTDK